MPVYKIEHDNKAIAAQHFDGVNAFSVQANSATEAKDLAKGSRTEHNTVQAALWNAATVTDQSSIADFTGWSFKVAESTVLPNGVTVVGVATDNMDAIGTKLAAALVAAGLATAAYNSGTKLLTVEASGANHGANTITVTVTPPVGLFPAGYTLTVSPIGVITHQGIAASALTVQLNTTYIIPARLYSYKQ